METKFNFKCPICGKTVRNTNVIRTLMSGRMCMNCFLRTQDDNANIKRINMNEFNFTSAICTSRSQSERLLALGLKKETADIRGVEGIEHTPTYAWSLDRLREMLNKSGVTISFVERDTSIIIERYGVFQNLFEIWDNVYDNICDAVEWLIKEGYFNKEYLV